MSEDWLLDNNDKRLEFYKNVLSDLDSKRTAIQKRVSELTENKKQEDYAYLFSLDWADCIEKAVYSKSGGYYILKFHFDINSKFYNEIKSYSKQYSSSHIGVDKMILYEIKEQSEYNFTIMSSFFEHFKNFADRLKCHIDIESNTLKEIAQDTYILNKKMSAITF